jgi:hypothetical protein
VVGVGDGADREVGHRVAGGLVQQHDVVAVGDPLAARLGPLLSPFAFSFVMHGPGQRLAAVDVQRLAGEERIGQREQDTLGDVRYRADPARRVAGADVGEVFLSRR